MIFAIVLPEIAANMALAQIHTVHCAVGEELKRGGKVLDVKVDLSAVFEHDCPPVSFYRLASSTRLWVREVRVEKGRFVRTGDTLCLCSTEPDEELTATAPEPARVSVVSILGHGDLWA